MRILISVDIEGVAGVSRPDQTTAGALDYDNARRLMTGEANAAIRGCFAAGASDVIVADAHGGFGNLLPDLLDARARLAHGRPRALGMLEGLQEKCDAVMLVGYHAMAGASGVLAHTLKGLAFHRIWLNNMLVGEAGLYGLLAGEYRVPVVLCTGDDAFARETPQWLPQTHFAVVKTAVGNRAAISLSPANACELIEFMAQEAAGAIADIQPIALGAALCCRVEAKTLALADLFSILPGARRVDPLEVEFDAGKPSEVLGVLALWAAAAASI